MLHVSHIRETLINLTGEGHKLYRRDISRCASVPGFRPHS